MLLRESSIYHNIHTKSTLLLSLENLENSLGRISTIVSNSEIVPVVKIGRYCYNSKSLGLD